MGCSLGGGVSKLVGYVRLLASLGTELNSKYRTPSFGDLPSLKMDLYVQQPLHA